MLKATRGKAANEGKAAKGKEAVTPKRGPDPFPVATKRKRRESAPEPDPKRKCRASDPGPEPDREWTVPVSSYRMGREWLSR